MTKDEVREKIAKVIHLAGCDYRLSVPRGSKVKRADVERTIDNIWADAILAIPEIAIMDREATLPKNRYPIRHGTLVEGWKAGAYTEAQQDMLDKGFRKVVTE